MNFKKLLGKKGQFGLDQMLPTIITFLIVGVTAVVALQLLSEEQATYVTNTAGCNATHVTACGATYNATVDGISGVSKFPEKLPMIAGVLVLVLVISILIAAFQFRR
jgi:hypothetical protein